MAILDFFKPVPAITPDDARMFIKEKQPGEYNLVDVRQPAEYERGHIPGAMLIPVAELHQRMGEIDRGKPTIVY